jgi:putative 4-mercaptohistidine N1-methyltranferase
MRLSRPFSVRSTTASGSTVYESERAMHEYVQTHYGLPGDIYPYPNAPTEAITFISKTVEKTVGMLGKGSRKRALDIGCAVGGSSFELARYFEEVVGIDYSHAFINAAQQMQQTGALPYESEIEGGATRSFTASIDPSIDRSRVEFTQGDACALPESLGTFDLVFASNLLCRLPDPMQFLSRLRPLVRPDGLVALFTPCSWLEEYTPREKWLSQPGESTSSRLQREMDCLGFHLTHREDVPFLLREHARKFQMGVSEGTFWRLR